jgi:hypothetical protein
MPLIADLLSLCFHRLQIFWFYLKHSSNRTTFPNIPKTIPREDHRTFSTKSSSRWNTSSQVEQLGSLRELTFFIYRRTIEIFFLSFYSKYFLGCAPFFSYRDLKGHHHGLSHPLGMFLPFTNPCVQMNHRTT